LGTPTLQKCRPQPAGPAPRVVGKRSPPSTSVAWPTSVSWNPWTPKTGARNTI